MKTFLIAGEHSGDILGADLILALQNLAPDAQFYGAGGPRMAAIGQRQSVDLVQHGVIGTLEVIRHYPTLRRYFNQLLSECTEIKPDAVVLIDYPGFNLRFLQKLRSRLPDTRIFYYVSPQLWAWKSKRAKILQAHADAVLCIFPFEPDWYKDHAPKLKTYWVGHPILDRLFLPESNARSTKPVQVALLPGSRDREVRKHLPLLLDTAKMMALAHNNFAFVCLAPTPEIEAVEREVIEQRIGVSLDIQVLSGYTTTHLSRSHLAIVASGTATLECAIANTPMIVFYHVNPLTYFLGKWLIKVPYLCMVNLLLDKPAVPELIQSKATAQNLTRTALELLSSEPRCRQQRADLQKVVEMLGEPGASANAARIILRSINPGSVKPSEAPKK
jgi:lipid-A-disaccharide synthase